MKKYVLILVFLLFVCSLSAQTYADMVARAMDYVEKEDYQAAEGALLSALRKEPANPNNAMLMVNLGTIQRNLGKLEEALLSYDVAVQKYPNAPFPRHNRAALYCEMERFDDAMKDYNTILLIDDKDIEALYRRGLLNLNNKNLFAAEEDFEKIIELEPTNLSGKAGLAMIMKRRGEWEPAEKVYSELISEHKANADLYINRAECYLQLKKLARCSDDIAKALELGYNEAYLYILRGQLRLAQYDKLTAKTDFLKAKELNADATVIDEMLHLCK